LGREEPSSDTARLNYLGAAFTCGVTLGITTIHWGLAANCMDMEFQVDNLTYGFRDRKPLLADGWTWSFSTDASWSLSDRFEIDAEVFYSPLSVVRPPSETAENDPLRNLRTILRIRL
jgi:hypothetical protein